MVQGAGRALRLFTFAFAAASCGGGGGGGGDAPAVVSSGHLDSSYGTSGKVSLAPDIYQNVVVDNDGNAYVGVETLDSSQGYVLKLAPSGAVATGYGDAGRAVVSPAGAWMGAMTLDAAGNLYAATYDLGVVQFDAAGHRVPSVGDRVFAPGLPTALVRLSDGTFYVAVVGGGFTGQTSGVLYKYDRNGRLDAAQGGASIASGFPVVVVDEARGVLYVAYRLPQTGSAAVSKFDLATRALTGLSGDFVALCRGSSWGVGMDVDSAHNVYVATTCGDSGAPRATIWKFDPLGQLVTTFGNGGSRTAIFGPDSEAMAPRVGFVRVGPDGSVYVGGASDQGGCYKLTIAKIDPQGRDVAGFGTGGKLVVDVGDSAATKIELDGHGRLYALGYSDGTCSAPSSAPRSFFMVRTGA